MWPANHGAGCHWHGFWMGGGEAMLHPTFGPWQVAWWSHKETEPRLHGSLLIRSAHWLPCCRAAKENKTTIREAFVMD